MNTFQVALIANKSFYEKMGDVPEFWAFLQYCELISLPKKQREIVNSLQLNGGLSCAELAEKLEIPGGASLVALHIKAIKESTSYLLLFEEGKKKGGKIWFNHLKKATDDSSL